MAAHKLFYHPAVHVSAVVIFLSSIVLAATLLLNSSQNALADISSCSASISPSQLNKQTDTDVTININNTDSNTVNWIKIKVPNPSLYTLAHVSVDGWTESYYDGETSIQTGGTLDPSSSLDVTVNVATEDTDSSSAWTVQVSDDGNGGAPFSCSGSLGTAIVSSDNQAPTISNLTLSNITSSSLTITWTTDVSSTSVVDYGTTSSYGSTKSDTSMTTSHTINIDSLSANTTYHFKAKSTNSADVTGDSGDQTFTTAKAGLTSDPITITTTTTTTRTVTPTPVIDNTPPYVVITSDFSKPFLFSPSIKGTATDKSGIANIEYSLDDGRTWSEMDDVTGLGRSSASFSFTAPIFDDDNYEIKVRATDLSSNRNIGVSKAYTLVIDRLPPSLVGNVISVGPQVLFPTIDGYLLTSTNIQQKITITTVGGPTKIDLSANKVGAASQSAKTYSLERNPDNGLWSTTLQFDESGIYTLTSRSIDGAANTTEQTLNKIAVLDPGKVLDDNKKSVKDAKVTLYYFEEKYQLWRKWDGNSYFQKNPQTTDLNGSFSYLLPSGKYYFDVRSTGFQNTVSDIFIVEHPTILNPVFELKPLTLLLDLWLFKLYLPDFSISTVPVTISAPILPKITDDLTGKLAPVILLPTTDEARFDLINTRGTPVALTFINILSPQSYDQLTALDSVNEAGYKAFAVMIGNTLSKTTILKKSANYKTTFVVDSDAKTVEDYKITTLPTHFFLDRRGVIRKIIPGILNKKEMEDELLEIQ